jgi:hypothetical protein
LILIKKYQKTPQKSISIEKNINNNISLIQNNQAKTKENNPVGQISILRNGQKLTKVGNIFELVKPWYQAIVKNGNNTYKLKFIQGTKYSQKDKMLETAEAYPAYISVLIWKQNRNNQWQLIDKSLNFMKSGQAGEAFPISPHFLVLNGDYSNIFDENITFIFIPNIGWNQGYTTKDYTILTFDGNSIDKNGTFTYAYDDSGAVDPKSKFSPQLIKFKAKIKFGANSHNGLKNLIVTYKGILPKNINNKTYTVKYRYNGQKYVSENTPINVLIH